MTLNQILDIAVVLVGVYATLSCICSAINEKIASWLRLRGWTLFKGVLALVDTHEMAARVFNHPLIATQSPDAKKMKSDGTPAADPSISLDAASGPGIVGRVGRFWQIFSMKPPSYVDARDFSSALWHTLATTHAADLTAALSPPPPANANAAQPNANAAQPNNANAAQPPANAANANADVIAIAQLAVTAPAQLMTALEQRVAGLPDGAPLKGQLSSLIAQAGNDYTKLLAATDGWFNAQMDRVSGWYKREVAWIMAVITLVIVTLTGVDSIEMVRILSAQGPDAVAKMADTVGASITQSGTDKSITSTFDITSFVHPATWPNVFSNWAYRYTGANGATYARWPGMVATYFALLLGGPFWFQALQSLANIRSSGRKPKRSDQPPK